MSNPFEEMIKKFSDAVPEQLRNAQEDLEQNVRGILESGLQKMNLVTREEFEIQSAVLQRTREKLDALEKKVAAMEVLQMPATVGEAVQEDAVKISEKSEEDIGAASSEDNKL